jgi:dephospho-CoA kinase
MGKTTTAKLFSEAGAPVHDADATVHRLYEGEAAPLIEAEFPGTTEARKVDRDKLAQRVLGDHAALNRLEALVHPLVRAAEQRFLAQAKQQGAAVAVLDIPLLYETGADARVDAVVVVSAPPEVQRQRAFERPGMTADKLQAILARQMPDAEKCARADFVVDSSRGIEAAREQVLNILQAAVKLPPRPK